MARGIDRLRSLLPDTELILNARESFMNVQGHYNFYNQALKKKQFGKFLNFFEKEIEAIDDTALKIKRIKLRFLANLNSVELELNTYRKQYKKAPKKNKRHASLPCLRQVNRLAGKQAFNQTVTTGNTGPVRGCLKVHIITCIVYRAFGKYSNGP